MNYNFHMPTKFITGIGCIQKNSPEFKKAGGKCLIVTGKGSAKKSGALDDVTKALAAEQIAWAVFDEVEPNPLLATCHRAGELARKEGAEFIVGIGGGSALDAAKSVAVFASNPMEKEEIYNLQWKNPPLPIIAVGTTAGTGSEVGPFAVLTAEDGHKRSISGTSLFPAVSFGDPKYTSSLPRNFTISTALDSLAHAIEAYFNKKANDMTDLIAIEAIKMDFNALRQIEPLAQDAEIAIELREQLYYASVLAGIVLGQCGTCYCHRLSYHLTERYGVSHGTACAVFLPGLLERSQKMVPDKTTALFSRLGFSIEELSGLIQRLTVYGAIKMDDAEINEIVKLHDGSPNFANTLPNGFDGKEAYSVLKSIFS